MHSLYHGEPTYGSPWVMAIEVLLFDFGGTIDSDGVHPRTVFLRRFKQIEQLEGLVEKVFQKAYTEADQRILREGLALGLNLQQMNRLMVELIIENLGKPKDVAEVLASQISEDQKGAIERNVPTLKTLAGAYHLGIVSNFCGNLTVILEQFGLEPYFKFVIDSYHVGVSKPDPKIFQLALSRAGVSPEQAFFVGDHPDRDIRPAAKLGMGTFHVVPGKSIRELPQYLNYAGA